MNKYVSIIIRYEIKNIIYLLTNKETNVKIIAINIHNIQIFKFIIPFKLISL